MPSPDDRVDPPFHAGEFETLTAFLDHQRSTLEWKCSGLDGAGLAATVASSSMTLGGLLKHLAYVEDDWFSRHLLGARPHSPWDGVDWSVDPDWDWHSAGEDSPAELFALWRASVARSRTAVSEAMTENGLDTAARGVKSGGRRASLRWILVHMIEEYARHNGHADLIRESIDGEVGE